MEIGNFYKTYIQQLKISICSNQANVNFEHIK
jgi:hypothetical protein